MLCQWWNPEASIREILDELAKVMVVDGDCFYPTYLARLLLCGQFVFFVFKLGIIVKKEL